MKQHAGGVAKKEPRIISTAKRENARVKNNRTVKIKALYNGNPANKVCVLGGEYDGLIGYRDPKKCQAHRWQDSPI